MSETIVCGWCKRLVSYSPSRARRSRFCSVQCSIDWKHSQLPRVFWSRVDFEGPKIREHLTSCWDWTGYVGPDGYGRFCGSLTHRVAWEYHHNSTPTLGLFVCHICDRRSCVNPYHLFLGTSADNSRDMALKGRARRGPGVPKGTSHKLNQSDVLQIKALVRAGSSQKEVARLFRVDSAAVSRIVRGISWSHLHGR